MNLITTGNAVTMTSREIAELVGKRHDNVKRTIEALAESGVIESPQIEEIPTATKPVAVYVFTGEKGKRDSIVVVAQLSPEFTAALVDRWQELEGRKPQPVALPSYAEALRLYADQIEETQRVAAERDQAIATKALIGSKREASAMATASAAKREAARLAQELGRGVLHATIIAVEKATGLKFGTQGFRPLQKWCKAHGVTPVKVPCPRYGEAASWPARAWSDCYDVSLADLFGAEA